MQAILFSATEKTRQLGYLTTLNDLQKKYHQQASDNAEKK